ncbi:MAG TPA: NAD-dependent epimerase/dehydratase family protein, partial [Chthoniobacteraceae bacterium]|nr:NAD-dependent epimerase/dehydratase family protein [Chthoniobacteraceae bacterium]
ATEASIDLLQNEPLAMFDTAAEGTRAALAFAAASGTRRFLLTSSGAVYGRQPPDMTHVPETYVGGPDIGDPMSAYGEGKRAAEMLCACYRRKYPDLSTVVARCFAFVGPILPLDAHFAIGNFIRDALKGGPIQVGGDGAPYRSYLYAADLAVWLWTLLFKGEAGVAYNVGSAEDLDIETLARAVARHAQPPCEINIARPRTPGAPPSRYVPDVTRISRELKLPPIIGLGDAIARTFAFHRAITPL